MKIRVNNNLKYMLRYYTIYYNIYRIFKKY